jgi:hypothetical protein
MYKLAEMFHLTRIDWQFFGTLTFSEPFLRNREQGFAQQRRYSLYNSFGREISRSLLYTPRRWEVNINAVRLEQGEIGRLWHYHFLMSGFAERSVNPGTAKFMESTWLSLGGGFTRIRVFDTSQNGVEYISKCLDPRNVYEFNKFGLASTITLSPMAVRVLTKPWRNVAADRSALAEKKAVGYGCELAIRLSPAALITNPA